MLQHKIALKLTVGAVATVLIAFGIFAYFNIQAQKDSLLVEVERHANQLSEHLKSDTRLDMLQNDRERILASIRRIGEQESIDRVRVFNKAGVIIYSSGPGDIGQMVDQNAESCFQCHAAGKPLEHLEMEDRTRIYETAEGKGRLLGVINPIYNEPSCWSADCHAHPRQQTVLGVLDVTLPLDAVDANIAHNRFAVLVFAISAIVVLSLIIGLMVRRWIGKPVTELLDATREVAGGNLAHRVTVATDDELGKLGQSFNAMTDKLAEARLQLFQSDKLASLGRLAAGVAHEINNPLTAVLTNSSYLLKRSKDRPELASDLEVIVNETIRCREIVKSLLDFARQTVPKKRNANINDIIRRAAKVVENQLAIGRVELKLELADTLPEVTVDANQIQQVFINLIVNASDAIGESTGTIRVATRAIHLSSEGMVQIKRAMCRKRHDLVDRKVKIDGKPAIAMHYQKGEREGLIHLDPMYGSHAHQLDDMPPLAEGVDLACPECAASLIAEDERCPRCGAPIYQFEVPLKGLVRGCLAEGCTWHHWKEVDESWNDQFVEVRVEDDGCGIPKAQIARLFEPFATTKGQKGTGLGLAVSWGIIDNHNGTIKVESEENVGTTFIVHLPVQS
jgi:two-component system NtrC family sensor kinase